MSAAFTGALAGADASRKEMERVMGIEPTLAAWEAAVLPLNYTRAWLPGDDSQRLDGSQSWEDRMQVVVNGREVSLPDGGSVRDLLLALGRGEGRIAVEVNQEIVPRSEHAAHVLQPGDRVELVHAMGGG
jgi:sulfur carrier protein